MKTYIAAVATLAAVFVAWYLNHLAEPDLRYQISSPIPAEIDSGAMPRVVQQIEIANVGKAPAHPVRVRIKKTIGKLSVIKDSEADKYEQFTTPTGSVELVYDNLIPGGRVNIIIAGGTLSEQDIDIRDQHRPAKLALTSQGSSWLDVGRYISWTLIILYGYLSLRSITRWLFDHKARYSPEDLLQRQRPALLVSAEQWQSCQDTAVDRLSRKDFNDSTEASSWPIYRLLTSAKPRKIADCEWAKLAEKLANGLVEKMKVFAAQAHSSLAVDTFRTLLSTVKPPSVSEKQWHEVMQRLGELYVSAALANLVRWQLSSESLLQALAEAKPSNVDEGTWEGYTAKLRLLYYVKLTQSLQLTEKPFEFIRHADLKPLEPGDAQRLEQFAYRLESSKLPNITTAAGASKFLESPKPAFMTKEDYDARAKVAEAVRSLHSRELQVGKREEQLESQELETSALKARVLRQLEIIDAFTSDPGSLDGVEDYEGAFAARNLANLKLLGELRKKAAAIR